MNLNVEARVPVEARDPEYKEIWRLNAFTHLNVFFGPREKAYITGKAMCERLKDAIPRQLFEIAVQAAIGSKIIARET